MLFLAGMDQEAVTGPFKETTDLPRLRQIEKAITPEVLRKMNDGGMHRLVIFYSKMHVVITPVMRQVRADQDDVTGMKALDMVADELGAAAPVEDDQLRFGVIVPAVIDKGIPVVPDAERMRGSARN